jgi:hypothetical protein
MKRNAASGLFTKPSRIGSGDGLFIEVRRASEARPFSRERRVAVTGLAYEGIAARTCRPEEIREV